MPSSSDFVEGDSGRIVPIRSRAVNMNRTPRIALIHAVYVAMAPIEAAFQARWPQTQRVNLIDDSLPADLSLAGRITPELVARIEKLAHYARSTGADGILFTCSAFGEAIEAAAAKLSVPVLKPNAPMFEAALKAGCRVGMLATFPPAVASMEAELRALAEMRQVPLELTTVCVPEALAAARAGDVETHNALLARAVDRFPPLDALMLSQFSMSPALQAVQAAVQCHVLSAPEAAVDALKARLESEHCD